MRERSGTDKLDGAGALSSPSIAFSDDEKHDNSNESYLTIKNYDKSKSKKFILAEPNDIRLENRTGTDLSKEEPSNSSADERKMANMVFSNR